MSHFEIVALLVTISAVFSYINHRFIRLPTTIGLMAIALVFSLGLTVLGYMGFSVERQAEQLLSSIDFNAALMGGMLSFLLFAGALHTNLEDLASNKWTIGTLATFGVVLSTFLIGLGTYAVLFLFEVDMPLIYCLVFGSLISPTDPIAVLSILKSAGAPRSLAAKIAGESLFNDGVGVVVFLVLAGIAAGHGDASPSGILSLLLTETGGGLLLGLGAGWLTFKMLKSVDNYQVEILLTLALVTGSYALASRLHLSGPIVVVVAGLMIGNRGRLLAMSSETREHLDTFWELVDEILNAVLFVLIGLEVLLLSVDLVGFWICLSIIPLVLLARLIAVSIPVAVFRRQREFSPGVIRILTWGGLRGGISVALALSLPVGPERALILPVTYAVVVFSILVQGLTIGRLVKKVQAN